MARLKTVPKNAPEPQTRTPWAHIRDVAKKEETKFSTTTTETIAPSTLLGTYLAVWDAHTGMESEDGPGQEISWLELEADSAGADTEVSFTDIRGTFKWWSAVGSFKGLKRDPTPGAVENFWRFDDVSWRELGEEDQEEAMYDPDDEEKLEGRAKDGFGLAAVVTHDDQGNPFLEMLYNAGKAETANGARGEGGDYCRILWKKQKVAKSHRRLEISRKEARRLMKDGTVDLSETRGELEDMSDEDDQEDAEGDGDEEDKWSEEEEESQVFPTAGVKRDAEDVPGDVDDEDEGPSKPKKAKK